MVEGFEDGIVDTGREGGHGEDFADRGSAAVDMALAAVLEGGDAAHAVDLLEPVQLRRLEELERENNELKKIVAEQALDIRILKDVNSKNG